MSNNPRSDDHMEHRWNSLYPLPETVHVRTGDHLSTTINVDVEDERVTWRVIIGEGSARRVFNQSTFFASILTSDDVERLAKTHVPRLGSKGAMWRAGLEMVAQGLTIGELERELGEQFPALLTSAHKVSEFVGHLVATAEA
jgi:hypothetical protein